MGIKTTLNLVIADDLVIAHSSSALPPVFPLILQNISYIVLQYISGNNIEEADSDKIDMIYLRDNLCTYYIYHISCMFESS